MEKFKELGWRNILIISAAVEAVLGIIGIIAGSTVVGVIMLILQVAYIAFVIFAIQYKVYVYEREEDKRRKTEKLARFS